MHIIPVGLGLGRDLNVDDEPLGPKPSGQRVGRSLAGVTRVVVSEDEEEVVIVIGDNDTTVPRKALAPRELGLEVLRRADEIAWLLTEYTWEEE